MAKKSTEDHNQVECLKRMLAVKDAVNVLEGRWKVLIIVALAFGKKRFKELSKDIPGITDKSLSKELKDLEMNKLISRTVYDTFPPTVEYSITPHGATLEKVVTELGHWGEFHRKEIIGK